MNNFQIKSDMNNLLVELLYPSTSIAEKCLDIWGILNMAPVKSVQPGNNSFSTLINVDLNFYRWDFRNLSWF